MKLEEAKEILLNVIADEVIGTYCTEIQKTTECSKNCENEDCFLQHAIETVIAELHAMQNLLDEKNEEIEHLQKENEELRDIDLITVHIKGVCDEKERWRNKIKELILSKKQKIQENNNEIEECRKTIMEEQELKKLKLYILHKNNELLEREIADLFDLLKEE